MEPNTTSDNIPIIWSVVLTYL